MENLEGNSALIRNQTETETIEFPEEDLHKYLIWVLNQSNLDFEKGVRITEEDQNLGYLCIHSDPETTLELEYKIFDRELEARYFLELQLLSYDGEEDYLINAYFAEPTQILDF